MKHNVYVDQDDNMIAMFESADSKNQKCIWLDEKADELWRINESYESPHHETLQKLFKSFNGITAIKLRPATPEEIVVVKLSGVKK